jgi:hypothetical protein
MSIRTSIIALAFVTACGTDGGDSVTSLVGAGTAALEFTQHANGSELDYRLQVGTNQMSGYRVEILADQRMCRHLVANATAMADPAQLVGALDASKLDTLTGDACTAATAGCGGPDTYLGVAVDGGARYTMQPSMCQTLLADANLESSLRAAFDSLGGVMEQVEPNGSDYVVLGPCP